MSPNEAYIWSAWINKDRLRWKENDTWFEIHRYGFATASPDDIEMKNRMIQLAESLVRVEGSGSTIVPAKILTPTHPFKPMDVEEKDLGERYLRDITYIQKEMGAWVKALPFNYGFLEYRGFDINTLPSSKHVMLRIEYGPAPYGAIAILQGQGDFPPTLSEDGSDDHYSAVPPEAIEQVVVNGQPGEYVAGGFVQMAGSDLYTWTNEISMARLRWKEGEQEQDNITRFLLGYRNFSTYLIAMPFIVFRSL